MKARDMGFPFEGQPGKYNAITDVAGVEVGYCTIIEGEATEDTSADSAFARTGVTAILPRGKRRSAVFAGRNDLNGNGELTGTHWVDDSGFLHGPIMITNTNSVGIVRDTTAKWMVDNDYFYPSVNEGKEVPGLGFFYPVVGETFDGALNNINGFRVKPEHVLEALESAKSGPVGEGCVGGGTGMRCHGFKGGTGTASRIVTTDVGEYTLGVLVQANHATREELRICGIPFGAEIQGCEADIRHQSPQEGAGSIIVVMATDAPFMPWQLSKISRRASLGITRVGGGFHSSSGDIFIAFSTANEGAFSYTSSQLTMLSDNQIDPFFTAAAQAVEEAIVNALVSATDMTGRNLNFVPALPHDQVKAILKKYRSYLESAYPGYKADVIE